MVKKFIRFICNTKDHSKGEKVKALNVITKTNGIVQKPYMFAQEHQIEIDIEGTNYKKYLPLHHFKHVNGKIIKKSDIEIQTIDAERTKIKQQKELEKEQKEQEIINAKKIINDESKTDSEKLAAMIDILKKEGVL